MSDNAILICYGSDLHALSLTLGACPRGTVVTLCLFNTTLATLDYIPDLHMYVVTVCH